jgi:uncharacterized protein HemY
MVRRKPEDAAQEYAQAVAEYERLVQDHPESPGNARDLAWLLAMCSRPELRDPGRAVTLARRATTLAPEGGDCWRALGAALCRSEKWSEAIEALNKSVALRAADGRVLLLLALAHAKLGDRDRASDYYDQVRPWPAKAGTEPLERRSLRTEVGAALKPPG